jgi:hypothetical protein
MLSTEHNERKGSTQGKRTLRPEVPRRDGTDAEWYASLYPESTPVTIPSTADLPTN